MNGHLQRPSGPSGGASRTTCVTALALALVLLSGCSTIRERADIARAHRQLTHEPLAVVADEQRLRAYGTAHQQLRQGLAERSRRMRCEAGQIWACPPSRRRGDEHRSLDRVEVVGSRIKASDVITNNQEAGVDEGNIVKKSGRFLFVLRRGWLHVVDTGTRERPAIDLIQSLQVATDPSGETVWYDEILAYHDRLILVGFNYAEDVAELISYGIANDGRLQRAGRYWLRTRDYYSTSNYGTRIEGDNLLLILAMPLDTRQENAWPVWSRRDTALPQWHPLLDLESVHLPLGVPLDPVIHLVVRCPLAGLQGDRLDCSALGVVGEADSQSYVTDEAAYLAVVHWPSDLLLDPAFDIHWPNQRFGLHRQTTIYRFPFAAGQQLTFAQFAGIPGTQFSFKLTSGRFYAAMRDPSDAMTPNLLLQSIGVGDFSGDAGQLASAAPVATLTIDPAHLTYRFTETALLVGSHSNVLREEQWEGKMTESGPSAPSRPPPPLLVQPLIGGPSRQIHLPHSADDVHPTAGGVAVSGFDQDDRWQVSMLAGTAMTPNTLPVPHLRPTEDRSHAFNHVRWGDGTTLMGWPVAPVVPDRKPRSVTMYHEDDVTVADLALLSWRDQQLVLAGLIDMQSESELPECKKYSPCHDWYGNARLFFFDGRIFALSGPRMVEATWDGVALRPVRAATLP